MSDLSGNSTAPAPVPALTAGAMLRQARQAQGLHIAALAAAIKVVPRKLELLETDQFDLLPGVTFTRALAQTVCRSLKIDSAPILALMPPPADTRLERVSNGLNTPFRERPGRLVPKVWASPTNPALWMTLALLLAALAVVLMPAGWLPFAKPGSNAASVDPAVTAAPALDAAPSNSSLATTTLAASAPPPAPGVAQAEAMPPAGSPNAAEAAFDPAAGLLQLRASAQSWIEVTDARGQVLIARLLQPGEDVALDGVAPLKIKVGNAAVTQVALRGQPVDLAAFTRDNVAKLELK